MKSIVRLTIAMACAIASFAHPAVAGNEDVTGTIRIATGTPASNGNSRPERCAYQADKSLQGLFGWVIEDVTPDMVFTVTATTPATDVDVDFFRSLTPCDYDPDKAAPEHDNHTGNERGVVPETAKLVIITLRNGPPTAGFLYHEQPPEIE